MGGRRSISGSGTGVGLLILLLAILVLNSSQDYHATVKIDKNQITANESFIIETSINFSKQIDQMNLTYILPEGWEQNDSSGQNCSKIIIFSPSMVEWNYRDSCIIIPKNAKPGRYSVTIEIAAANIRTYRNSVSIEVV